MDQGDTIKNFSYVGIARIATVALQALFYLLFAALLDPEVYGELSVILALASTFSISSIFGLNISLQVFRAKNKSIICDQIGTLFLVLTTFAAIILLFIEPVAALLCVTLSFFTLNQANLLGLKKYKKFMFFSILKSGTFFVIPIVLYFVFDLYGIILGMAISNFLGSLPILKNLKIVSFYDLKNNYKVLLHNFGVSVGTALPYTIDKLAIAPLFGFFIVGIYQFNFQIFIAVSILPGILYTYLVTEESSGKRHRKLSYIVIISSIVIAIIAMFLAPILIPSFFPKYVEGILALQILLLAIIPRSFTAILMPKLLAKESTKIGYMSILRIASTLIFIAVFGELFGLIGLSLAVLLTVIFTLIFLYFVYRKSISAENNINSL